MSDVGSTVDEALPRAPYAAAPADLASAKEQASPSSALKLAAAAVLLYLAYEIAIPLIPIPLRGIPPWEAVLLITVPTCLFMLLQLWLAVSVVLVKWRLKTTVVMAVGCLLLWGTTFFVPPLFAHLRPGPAFAARFLSRAFYDLSLSCVLFLLGVLLARIIREPNLLLPVAVIAMPIDYVGAMTPIGFTHTVEQHASQVVNAVSIAVPTVGGLSPIAFIGPGDCLFMAFFFCSVWQLGMRLNATFWWMFALLSAAMLVVLRFGFPIAALVPMGLAVIIPNVRLFRLKREEVFAMIYAALVVAVVVGVFYYVSHYNIEHADGARR